MSIIGTIAVVCTLACVAVGLVSQIVTNFRRKSCEGLSPILMVLVLLVYTTWAAYGIELHDWLLVLPNVPGALLSAVILAQFAIYGISNVGGSNPIDGSAECELDENVDRQVRYRQALTRLRDERVQQNYWISTGIVVVTWIIMWIGLEVIYYLSRLNDGHRVWESIVPVVVTLVTGLTPALWLWIIVKLETIRIIRAAELEAYGGREGTS